jgi:nitrate reductase gamma subunit
LRGLMWLIMTSDNYLFILIILLISVAVYGIVTNKVTAEERDQMLDSEDMFPWMLQVLVHIDVPLLLLVSTSVMITI